MMKKSIKILAAVCLLVLSTVLLSSCNYLDELRDQRIVILEDDMSLLEYKGNKYELLPNAEDKGVSINYGGTRYCYIVEEDLPLLLTDSSGLGCYYDEKLDLIIWDDFIYCTMDKHDEYSDILKNSELGHYKIEIWAYDEKVNEYIEKEYILNDRATELINGTLVNVVGHELDYLRDDLEFIYISACDSENFLEQQEVLEIVKFHNSDDYGVVVYNNVDGLSIYKKIPEEFEEVIAEIFDIYNSGVHYEKTEVIVPAI